MSLESCSKVLSTAGKPRHIHLYENRDRINQGYVSFFVFHFELTPIPDGQLALKSFSSTHRFSTGKNIERESVQQQ